MEKLRQTIKEVYEKYRPRMVLYNAVLRKVAELRSYELDLEMYRVRIKKLTPPRDPLDEKQLNETKKIYERIKAKKDEIEKELKAIAHLLCREEGLLDGGADE